MASNIYQEIISGNSGYVRVALKDNPSLVHDLSTGQTLLHLAVKYQQLEIIKILLSFGSKPINMYDQEGKSPFQIAIQIGNLSILEALIKNEDWTNRGFTISDVFAKITDVPVSTLMCALWMISSSSENGLSPYMDTQHTSLHYFVSLGNIPMIEALIGIGMSVPVMDWYEFFVDPIHYSRLYNHRPTIISLRALGITINYDETEGVTQYTRNSLTQAIPNEQVKEIRFRVFFEISLTIRLLCSC